MINVLNSFGTHNWCCAKKLRKVRWKIHKIHLTKLFILSCFLFAEWAMHRFIFQNRITMNLFCEEVVKFLYSEYAAICCKVVQMLLTIIVIWIFYDKYIFFIYLLKFIFFKEDVISLTFHGKIILLDCLQMYVFKSHWKRKLKFFMLLVVAKMYCLRERGRKNTNKSYASPNFAIMQDYLR